jgi:hypothetical protein
MINALRELSAYQGAESEREHRRTLAELAQQRFAAEQQAMPGQMEGQRLSNLGKQQAIQFQPEIMRREAEKIKAAQQFQRDSLASRERIAEARFRGGPKAPTNYRYKPDGSLEPIPGGPADPNVAADAATRKKREEMAMQLPDAIASAQQGLSKIDAMIGDLDVDEDGKVISKGPRQAHPGFSGVVGISGIGSGFGLAGHIPGTATTDFKRRLDEIKGGAFMQAFQSLKGGGQITEKEGEKATAAITRMDKSQSEKEFIIAAREFQKTVRDAVERAAGKAVAPSQKGKQGSIGRISNDAHYNSLPSGTVFTAPDGSTRRKP